MATNSNFDVGLCIEWKVRNSETPRLSPTFHFMDSRWHLETDISHQRRMYLAKLVNEDPQQEFPTLRVKTYKKIVKNKVLHFQQMYYLSSPNSCLIGELRSLGDEEAVVCFLTEVTQSTQHTENDGAFITGSMETNSSFDVRLGIEWKFNLSHGNPVSPVFSFMNIRWQLEACELQNHERYIIIHPRDGKNQRKKFQAISVTTYTKKFNNDLIFPQTYEVSSESCVIYAVWKPVPSWSASDDVTVVCFLGDGATSIQCTEKDAGNKAKCVSLDASSPSQSTSSADDTSYLSQSSFSTSECPLINLESLSQDFSNLLEKNVMPDVQLRSGDCTLTAHKLVLSARSEVFRAMFQHKMSETNSGVVDIEDIDPPVLSEFLKYLYTGKITEKLSDDMICKLYSVGDKYSVSSLSNLCSDFMAKCLREDNYLQILVLADAHSDEKLKKAVVEFVMKNNKLLRSENWITFSERQPRLANEIYRVHIAKSALK